MLNETVMDVLDSVNAIVENAGGNRLVVFNQATAARLSKCSFSTLRKFLKVVKTETYTFWRDAEDLDDDDKEYIMKKIHKGAYDVEERFDITIVQGKRNWYQINWDDVMEEYEAAVLKTQSDIAKLLSYDLTRGLV